MIELCALNQQRREGGDEHTIAFYKIFAREWIIEFYTIIASVWIKDRLKII